MSYISRCVCLAIYKLGICKNETTIRILIKSFIKRSWQTDTVLWKRDIWKEKKRVVFAFNKKQTPHKHMKYYLAINHAFGWIQDVGDRKGKEGLVS